MAHAQDNFNNEALQEQPNVAAQEFPQEESSQTATIEAELDNNIQDREFEHFSPVYSPVSPRILNNDDDDDVAIVPDANNNANDDDDDDDDLPVAFSRNNNDDDDDDEDDDTYSQDTLIINDFDSNGLLPDIPLKTPEICIFDSSYNNEQCPACFETKEERIKKASLTIQLTKCQHCICSICTKKLIKPLQPSFVYHNYSVLFDLASQDATKTPFFQITCPLCRQTVFLTPIQKTLIFQLAHSSALKSQITKLRQIHTKQSEQNTINKALLKNLDQYIENMHTSHTAQNTFFSHFNYLTNTLHKQYELLQTRLQIHHLFTPLSSTLAKSIENSLLLLTQAQKTLHSAKAKTSQLSYNPPDLLPSSTDTHHQLERLLINAKSFINSLLTKAEDELSTTTHQFQQHIDKQTDTGNKFNEVQLDLLNTSHRLHDLFTQLQQQFLHPPPPPPPPPPTSSSSTTSSWLSTRKRKLQSGISNQDRHDVSDGHNSHATVRIHNSLSVSDENSTNAELPTSQQSINCRTKKTFTSSIETTELPGISSVMQEHTQLTDMMNQLNDFSQYFKIKYLNNLAKSTKTTQTD